MRFSSPNTTSRLRKPISPSIQTTFLPPIASATARLAVVVVLPTPPFPDVIVATVAVMPLLLSDPCQTLLLRTPGHTHQLPIFNMHQLRFGCLADAPKRWTRFGQWIHHTCNA